MVDAQVRVGERAALRGGVAAAVLGAQVVLPGPAQIYISLI